MEDHQEEKAEASHGYTIDTRKTYDSIIGRKEARIAKEAHYERRARYLTKEFLKSHEQKESHKLDSLHEASQRSYERSMAKVKDGFNSEAMQREMFREENFQIHQLMTEKARQRELEEQKKTEAKAQREYYMQARIVHSQLQLEERQRRIEEKAQQKLDDIKNRKEEKKKAEKDKEEEENKDKGKEEAKLSPGAKAEKELEEAAERRKKANVQANRDCRERQKLMEDKEQRANEERQKRNGERQQKFTEAQRLRDERVLERKAADEEELVKKIERMNAQNRIRLSSSRSQDTPRSDPRACARQISAPKVEEPPPKNHAGHGGHGEAQREPDSPKTEAKKTERTWMPSFQDPKLIESNNLAHRDYVARNKELCDVADKMHVVKKYKALAEGASSQPEDYRSARLRAVHESMTGKKSKSPRAPERPRTETADNSDLDSPRRRQKPQAAKCGLCMREFPPERLVGSALRKTLEKMRNQSSNLPNNKGEQSSAQYITEPATPADPTRGSVDNASPSKQGSKQAAGQDKKRSLYDYEVKLCVNCDIFVRIAST